MRNILILSLILFTPLLSLSIEACSSPTSYTTKGGGGGNPPLDWGSGNVNNLASSDNQYNIINLDDKDKTDGYFDNFGFNLPSGATIEGFIITIEGYWDFGNGDCKKVDIELWSSPDKGTKYANCNSLGDGSDMTSVFGDPNDLMKFTGNGGPAKRILNSVDINDSSFGLKIKLESDLDGNTVRIDFIEICIHYTEGVLPIELVSFDCYNYEDDIYIEWLSNEINNSHYIVEHSTDGYVWKTIKTIDGVGNSNKMLKYDIIHYSPPIGQNYYKLKQVDFDGKSEMFHIINCDKYTDETLISEVIYCNILGQEVDRFTLGLVIIITKYMNGNIDIKKTYNSCC